MATVEFTTSHIQLTYLETGHVHVRRGSEERAIEKLSAPAPQDVQLLEGKLLQVLPLDGRGRLQQRRAS